MGFIHGKNALVKVAGVNISLYTNEIDMKRSGDSHDITCFGAVGHAYLGGLTDGTISLKGIYNDGDTSFPRQVVGDALGTVVAFVYQAEGAVSTDPNVNGTVLVTAYEEVASATDVINWSAELQITGTVTTTDQA